MIFLSTQTRARDVCLIEIREALMLWNNEQKNQVQKQQRANERSETMVEKKRGDLRDAETVPQIPRSTFDL